MYMSTEPASPPVNIMVTATSSQRILVEWDEVVAIDQNGVITIYEVQYEPLETFGNSISTMTVNTTAPQQSVNLTNLQEYVEYNISVRAYTSVGEGPYSTGIVARTFEDGKSKLLS